jgi:hypothetical protein
MSTIVKFSEAASLYLTDLVETLYISGYFHFYESSALYVRRLVNEIVMNIHLQPKKSAPLYFSRYGENMYYITCRRNRTTWYVFFTIHGEYGNYYLVRHITNNHVAGHHFLDNYLTETI